MQRKRVTDMDREKNNSVRRPGRRLAVIILAIALSIAMMPLAAFAGISAEDDGVNAAEASVDNDTRDGPEGRVVPENEVSGGGVAGKVAGNGRAGDAADAKGENGSGADLKAEENGSGADLKAAEDGSNGEGLNALEVKDQDAGGGEEDIGGDGDRISWADSVYVLGIQVNSSNCDDVLNDGGSVKYDRETSTITLKNARLDIKDFDSSAFTETNKVYGISTWGDTNLVLSGSNTIVSSGTSFESGTEYVYGIEAIRGLNVSGSGSLSIEIDSYADSGIEQYIGIDSTGRLSVSSSTVNVSMEGSGDSCGIQTGWKGFALSGNAEVRAESTGGSSRAVYDSSYKKSTVEYGSSFEMISDYAAFQFSRLPDSVTDGRILVNTEATSDGADEWNNTTDLSTYKYVRLFGSDGGSRSSGEVYVLGRKMNDGDLPDEVDHSGKISYDSGSNTLTLKDAEIDLDNFRNASPGNLVAGIYATSDIHIVLEGGNKIKASTNDYGLLTEYVSGIESWGTVNISGNSSASLSVELADNNSGNSKKTIIGISADDSILVDGASLNIDMGQYGRCTGIYAWAPIYLNNAAKVNVNASGSSNMAVSGPNAIGDTQIGKDSELTMTSDGVAFNCWTPKDGLKQVDSYVSSSKDGSDAEEWDKKKSLRDYRYVQFISSSRGFGKDVRVLGRKITEENCNDVLADVQPGAVQYDMENKILTLKNADLDFADFDHEYDHDENPDSGTNMITGIDADDDITVVLEGRNRIFTTKESFDAKKEYVYGISSGMMNTMTITGEGTLDIAFDKTDEKLSYTGIDAGDELNIKGVAVNVDLGGELSGTGVDIMMGAIKLEDGATLRVKTSGEKSESVDYQFANKLSISSGSMLEMTSEGKAFNNYYLSQEVTEGGAMVNTEPTAEGAAAWDRVSYLSGYKYVRFPENYVHTHTLTAYPAKDATCTEAGNIAYWACWSCGRFFSDEGGTTEIDDPVIPRKGHAYENDWKSISDTQHQRVCHNDSSHKETEDHEFGRGKIVRKPTILKKGVKKYTCAVCGKVKTEEFTLADEIKDKAGKVAEKIREWIERIINGGDDPDVIPSELTVTLVQDTFTYNGKVQRPDIESVKAGKEVLEDYTVEYEKDSKNAGSYTVTVTFGIEEFSISGTAVYTIEPAEITDVTVSRTSFVYNGGVQKPSIVSVKADSLRLGASDYTYEYSDSRSSDVGDYSLTVEGKGNFCGSKTVPYVIRKAANPLSVSGKTATVRYKKLKKRAQTVSAGSVMSVNNAEGSVSYTLNSVSKAKYRKYFSVNSANGNVTIKKKLRKGTYTLNVSVSAAGNDNYDAAARTVAFKIKVK